MVVVLGSGDGNLPLRCAMRFDVPSGLHGVGVHVDGAARAGLKSFARGRTGAPVVVVPALWLQLIDRSGKNGGHAAGVVRAHELFNTDGHADLRLAAEHVFPRAMKSK